MKKTRIIHKYQLLTTSEKQIISNIPKKTDFLFFGVQDDQLCLWGMHDQDTKETEDVTLYVYCTGETIPYCEGNERPIDYFDSVQHGRFVWHLFIERKLLWADDAEKNIITKEELSSVDDDFFPI